MFRRRQRAAGEAMPRRNVILAAAFLAATLAPAHFQDANAESYVKTKSECTRYGGRATRDYKYMDKTYPWVCDTPARDRQCVKQLGKRGYFDAEFGKCKKMTQEQYECYIFDDCW